MSYCKRPMVNAKDHDICYHLIFTSLEGGAGLIVVLVQVSAGTVYFSSSGKDWWSGLSKRLPWAEDNQQWDGTYRKLTGWVSAQADFKCFQYIFCWAWKTVTNGEVLNIQLTRLRKLNQMLVNSAFKLRHRTWTITRGVVEQRQKQLQTTNAHVLHLMILHLVMLGRWSHERGCARENTTVRYGIQLAFLLSDAWESSSSCSIL